MDRVEAELLRVIHARYRITPDLSSKIADLNLDSIKIANFLRELEDEFDVAFDQDVFEVETIADLATDIRGRLAEFPEQV
jgi:acyl carrier protein